MRPRNGSRGAGRSLAREPSRGRARCPGKRRAAARRWRRRWAPCRSVRRRERYRPCRRSPRSLQTATSLARSARSCHTPRSAEVRPLTSPGVKPAGAVKPSFTSRWSPSESRLMWMASGEVWNTVENLSSDASRAASALEAPESSAFWPTPLVYARPGRSVPLRCDAVCMTPMTAPSRQSKEPLGIPLSSRRAWGANGTSSPRCRLTLPRGSEPRDGSWRGGQAADALAGRA